jgi:hypothetical protein
MMYLTHVRARANRLLITLFLSWSLMPGGMELVEQAVHLSLMGHLAHATPDDPDEPLEDDEHGCQGLMHLCHCHQGTGQVGPGVLASWLPPPAFLRWMQSVSNSPDEPPGRGVFHPPKPYFAA